MEYRGIKIKTKMVGKIVGITRIRNEEHIIQKTLDHASNLVDEVYVYDDCSTDKTVEICKKHHLVKEIIQGKVWKGGSQERNKAEGDLRQIVYEKCLESNPDWVYYFDADEFADFEGIDFMADAYRLRLFDFYITEEDKDKEFYKRKWIGPEYRDILMLFKPVPGLRFYQREPSGITGKVEKSGFVKHYGKAISIEQFEKTCDYYINERGDDGRYSKFKNKWLERKGKAVHSHSDFGNKLIKWEERFTKGFLLVDK
jgi:glycosyltransferase involved in cell wall biosynthesis